MNQRPETSTYIAPVACIWKMFAPVFETYWRPELPSGCHAGAPSMTSTSAGAVETTIAGADFASDAVCDLSALPTTSCSDGASRLIDGCVEAHFVAAARLVAALPDGDPTVHGPPSAGAVIQPSAIFSQNAPDESCARSIGVLMTRWRFAPSIGCMTGLPWIGTSTVGFVTIESAGGLLRSGAVGATGAVFMPGTAASRRSSESDSARPAPADSSPDCSAFCFAGFDGSDTPVTWMFVSETMRLSLFTSVDALNESVPKLSACAPCAASENAQVPVSCIASQVWKLGG